MTRAGGISYSAADADACCSGISYSTIALADAVGRQSRDCCSDWGGCAVADTICHTITDCHGLIIIGRRRSGSSGSGSLRSSSLLTTSLRNGSSGHTRSFVAAAAVAASAAVVNWYYYIGSMISSILLV